MIWRGMRRRCGRCGSGSILESWFRLRERCPGCGYRFEREEGFAAGVWLLNFTVTEGLMVIGLMVFIVIRGVAQSTVALWPILLVTVAAAVVAPVLCYPFAKSTWAALDLAMRPLEPLEEAEALLAVQVDAHPGAVRDADAGGRGAAVRASARPRPGIATASAAGPGHE